MLRAALLSTLALTLALVPPGWAQSCTCFDGADYYGNPIDPGSTSCGFQVCGADDQFYRCTAGGWQAIGGGPCGTPPSRCACSGGTTFDGTEISSDATFCGMQICGLDDQLYECRPSGWHGIGGGPCSQGETASCSFDPGACACDGGSIFNPHGPIEIPIEDTYCGMTVCGADNQFYECTDSGWLLRGEGPCDPNAAADADGDTLPDGLEHLLIMRFAPKLRLHLADRYRPSSVEWFLDRVHMRFQREACDDEQVLDLGQVNVFSLLEQSVSVADPVSCLPTSEVESSSGAEPSDFFLQIPNDDEELRTRQGSTPADWTCYAHVLPSLPSNNVPPGNLDLQYWFFYPYNGLYDSTEGSAHEGDWEHVTVRLDEATLQPLRVFLAAHTGGSWHDWDEVRCAADGQPVVYSAENTHATYEREGTHGTLRRDFTSLLGPVWDCRNRAVNLGERLSPLPGAEWTTYSGLWGEVGGAILFGSSGPPSPQFNDRWDGVDD